jgi:hypothetical protein
MLFWVFFAKQTGALHDYHVWFLGVTRRIIALIHTSLRCFRELS